MKIQHWILIFIGVLALSLTPDIFRYIMINRAANQFVEEMEQISVVSAQRDKAFKQDMAKRKATAQQAKHKKEDQAAYTNAACVFMEDNQSCTCIDGRTGKRLKLSYSACVNRAEQYQH